MSLMQNWIEAMAAKDIDAAMATTHEDILMIMNEMVNDRSDLQEHWSQSMKEENNFFSDFNLKFEDEYCSAVDFKLVQDGIHLQCRMTYHIKDELVYRGIILAEPI